ncbi:hypothetical protein [Streptomyces lushanensis]|uniref:hypothetical protein n=1 Tax=Streptomyces lushanensis TaxID=1434255 RepID=UPI0008326832|nr:hypothetical protein [Streptomyces lushanensis]
MIGNRDSRIVVAAGPVTMSGKQPLTVTDIAESELRVVRQAWVVRGTSTTSVPTASDAVDALSAESSGLAVLMGPAGYGKRTAGIRALWQVSRSRVAAGRPMKLKEIQPDWEDPSLPDMSLLPDAANTGYLLDVAAELSEWTAPGRAAAALVAHAEKLARIGSCLVVVADERSWPRDASLVPVGALVRAKDRPSAYLVARAHLEYLYGKPGRADWIAPETEVSPEGPAARLLREGSAPRDGARLASMLAAVDGSPESVKTALSEFQEWSAEVGGVFKSTIDKPEDRALLVSGLFHDGEDVLVIQDGARDLLGEKLVGTTVREILSGPDLSDRLIGVGAEVSGRRASFEYRPGYARAVLLHLWHQRADVHDPLLKWLDGVVSGKSGLRRLAPISDLLVELAITENDIRVIDKIKKWIDASSDEGHLLLIANVLTRAAEADELGPAVRVRLLNWAQDSSESVTQVVALVCQGDFAQHFPRQALVRLRHILGQEKRGPAVERAEAALRTMAAADNQLPRVWRAVIRWATETRSVAGHRAFLSLLNPESDPFVLQVMLAAAQRDTAIEDALVNGWSAALDNPVVHSECRTLIHQWAHARADGVVPRELVTDILNRVIARHLMSVPISALVIGEPGVSYDEAVIELRSDLRLPAQMSPFPTITGHKEG